MDCSYRKITFIIGYEILKRFNIFKNNQLKLKLMIYFVFNYIITRMFDNSWFKGKNENPVFHFFPYLMSYSMLSSHSEVVQDKYTLVEYIVNIYTALI